MPSMSESPAAAALTRAGDINKSSGSPKGKALFGNRSSDAGDDGANTAGKATPSGEIMETDEDGKKEAIIAILEEWALWEKSLENAAAQNEVARSIKEVADRPASLLTNNSNLHHQSNEHGTDVCIVSEFNDASADAAQTQARKFRRATYSPGDTAGLLYRTRHERRRAERNDPTAKARRYALTAWAADKTKRQSSAGDEIIDKYGENAHPAFKKWAAFQERRRSSAELTVDHNRKTQSSLVKDDIIPVGRRRAPVPNVFGQRKVPPQREVCCNSGSHNPARSLLAETSKEPRDKAVSRRQDLHPWRPNMKTYEKHGMSGIEGEAPTPLLTLRSPGTMGAARASPWARSPSRETAGGILVKHSFFYGSGGRAATPGGAAASPSFESQWMRQFREEVQNNPNWWAGPDQHHHPGKSAATSIQSLLRGMEPGGKKAHNSSTTVLTTCKQGQANLETDLWQEVRALLAASGRHGGDDTLPGNRGGSIGGDGARTDILSFDDRLRYTPLSQGAWLVDQAGGEQSKSMGLLPPGGSSESTTIAVAERRRAITQQESGGTRTLEHTAAAASKEITKQERLNGKTPRGGQEGAKARDRVDNSDGRNDEGRENLQRVHDAILARLRGEIDSSTREEIVLRAAEDARGALSRDRAGSASPRRASSATSSRPWSGGTFVSVPDEIDYDKVETTLSLIELASRAAGPDAGKQMLQALEALDKIHQQVSVDEIAAKKSRLDGDGKDGPQELDIGGGHVEPPVAVVKAINTSDGLGDASAAVENTLAKVDEPSPESGGHEGGLRPLSRKASLAVSGSSNESTVSDAPTGVIQSIGNWLWATPKLPTQTNSDESAVEGLGVDGEQATGGRDGFAFELELEADARQDREMDKVKETRLDKEASEGTAKAQRASEDFQMSNACGVPPLPGVPERADIPTVKSDRAQLPGPAKSSVAVQTAEVPAAPVPPVAEAAGRTEGQPRETSCRASQTEQPSAPKPSPISETDVSPHRSAPLSRQSSTKALPTSDDPPHDRPPSEGKGTKHVGSGDLPIGMAKARSMREGTDEGLDNLATYRSSCHRDSWVSVGIRPRRAPPSQPAQPSRASEGDVGGKKRPGERGSIGTALAAVKKKPPADRVTRGVSRKVTLKFVWPRPGRLCSAKRLCPSEGPVKKDGSSAFRPGIVRRSPLIDALHPALVKQRAFQLQLRPTHRQHATGRVNHEIDKRAGVEAKGKTIGCAVDDTVASVTGNGSACERRSKRESLSEAPLPCPPSPSSQPVRPGLFTRSPKPGFSEGANSGEASSSTMDAAARAGRLTVLQWGCVEAWMARVRRSLGPRVWECLGSGPAYCRTRNHMRHAVLSESARQGSNRGCPLSHLHVPAMIDKSTYVEEQATKKDGCVEGTEAGPNMRKGDDGHAGTGTCQGLTGAWDDHLSQKAALAVEAIIWTLATDRERLNTCAAISSRHRKRGRDNAERLGQRVGGGDAHGEDNADPPLADTTDLGVSLPRARRFIKSSRLIDGIRVLDADADLAFKRWEEAKRVPKEEDLNAKKPRAFRADAPLQGCADAVLGTTEARALRLPLPGGAASRPRVCEAVGCSEVARYGDICPMATARLCRKHRRNGMTDVGGARCGRPDCWRLAVGGNPNVSTGVGALCTLHASEGRVDLEGLSFVLIALARARQSRIRRPPTTTAGAEGRSFSSEHDEETPDAAALNASAIRNVLLALTDQPLIPSSPKPAQTSPPAAQALTFRQAPTTVPGLGLAQNSIHLPTPASSLLWTEALPGAGASDMEQNSPSSSCSSGSPNGGVSEPGVGGEAFSRTAGYPDLETGDLGGRRDGAGSRAPSSVEGGGKDEPGSRTQHRARRGRSFLSREVEAQDDTSSDDEPYESASEEVVKPTHEVAFHRWAFGTQAISLVTNGGDNCCKGLGGPGKCNATSSRSRNLAHERIGCVGSTGDEARRRGVDEVLGKNAGPLRAVFQRYSRSSGCNNREMALPDVLRFCDAFELRPGLASTREILDTFKEVVFPGVIGLTDKEIGYCQPVPERLQRKTPPRSPAKSAQTISSTATSSLNHDPEREETGENGNVAVNDSSTATLGPEEDDECSVYFRSDSGRGGGMRAPSRRTSTASSGVGGRGKRTVYLGRSQKFPLRRVESSLAVTDRGFGLSGVSTAAGHAYRRSAGSRKSSLSQASSCSRRTSVASAFTTAAREAREPPMAPGLSLPQFFQWLSELALGCAALAKTFNHTLARRSREGIERCGTKRGPAPPLCASGRLRRKSGSSGATAARALALLQWMEVSRGMRKGGIPAFRLSSWFVEGRVSP